MHRVPTEGVLLPANESEEISKIARENEVASKGYRIEGMAWLKSKDKPWGHTASLGIWLDSAEAAEWVVNNGLVFGQRYIGSVEFHQMKRKRCHWCLGVGHLAWSCREKP